MRILFWKNILVLRGVAICSVVLAHAANASFSPFLLKTETISINQAPFTIISFFLIRSLSNFGILAFVFASGYMVYKMFADFKASCKHAFELFKKYLIWAVPLTVILAFWKSEITLQERLLHLLVGGPMPAYWFFVLIILLLLVSSFYTYLVKKHIKFAIALLILLQAMVFMKSYYFSISLPLIVNKLFIRTLTFTPPFIFGMIFANKSQFIINSFKGYKIYIFLLSILAGLCSFGESLFRSYSDNWNPDIVQKSFATERISITLFFVFVATLILLQKDYPNKLKDWLTKTGFASFGIFLMTDIFNMILTILLWHIPIGNLLAIEKTQKTSIVAPAWLTQSPLLVFPFYIVFGLYGPILIMRIARKYFGNKLNFLW